MLAEIELIVRIALMIGIGWWGLDWVWRTRVVIPRRMWRARSVGHAYWRQPGESRREWRERVMSNEHELAMQRARAEIAEEAKANVKH